MEHKLITGGGEHWLPFARSKIRAIRSGPLKYAAQRFVMPDDAEVAVRVVGDMEYIDIKGATRWDYLTWPTSKLHPTGFDTAAPRAALTLTKGGRKVQEKSQFKSARHDWLSYDGVKDGVVQAGKIALSYDNGQTFRYEPQGADQLRGAIRNIYRDGAEIKTAYGVKGCAWHPVAKKYIYVWYEYVNSLEYGFVDVATTLVIGYLDDQNKNADGMMPTVEIGRKTFGFPDVLAQPTYFDGAAFKFISSTDTITLIYSAPGALPEVTFGAPRKFVSGELTYNEDSKQFTVTFSTPPFDLPETSIVVENNASPLDYSDTNNNNILNKHDYSEGGLPPGAPWPGDGVVIAFKLGYTADGYRNFRRTVKSYDLIGVDMSVTGEQLVIRRAKTNVQYNTSVSTASNETIGTVEYVDESIGRTHTVSANEYVGQTTYTEDNRETTAYEVNGAAMYSVDTYHSVLGFTTYRTAGSTYDDYRTPATITRPPTYSISNFDTVVYRDLSLRDVDGRHLAVAVVEGERAEPFGTVSSGVPHAYKTTLRVKYDGNEHVKEIFNGSILALPTYANLDVYVYRRFASRRPGEYVVSHVADERVHGAGSSLGSYYQRLEELGGTVDKAPLMIAMRKGVESPLPAGFKIGGEAEFALQPIHLI